MCKARSEGGQRCSGHARDTLTAAESAYNDAATEAARHPSWRTPKKVTVALRKADGKLADARAQYASTPEGEADLRAQIAALPRFMTDEQRERRANLVEALTEGARLRARAAHIKEEVRAGRMTKEEATKAATYPSPQAKAFRADPAFHKVSTRTMAQPYITGAKRLAELGAAEQALRAKKAELAEFTDLRGDSSIVRGEIAIAENNLFDARVHYASTPEGEAALRTELAAIPHPPTGRSDADYREGRRLTREREDLTAAIDEGLRYRALKADLAEQANLGLITHDQHAERAKYPTEAVKHARHRAMMNLYDRDIA